MDRPPSCCDFCGNSRAFQEYETDPGVVNWYACAECARIIEVEAWEQLIERSIAAHGRVRPTPDGDEPVLRQQTEHLVEAFRALRLVAA
jgi:hypothetical protein